MDGNVCVGWWWVGRFWLWWRWMVMAVAVWRCAWWLGVEVAGWREVDGAMEGRWW